MQIFFVCVDIEKYMLICVVFESFNSRYISHSALCLILIITNLQLWNEICAST